MSLEIIAHVGSEIDEANTFLHVWIFISQKDWAWSPCIGVLRIEWENGSHDSTIDAADEGNWYDPWSSWEELHQTEESDEKDQKWSEISSRQLRNISKRLGNSLVEDRGCFLVSSCNFILDELGDTECISSLAKTNDESDTCAETFQN